MGLQNGTDVQENVEEVTYYDLIEVGSDGSLKTTFKAIGTAGSELGFVYRLNEDGTHAEKFTQDTAAGKGKFSYVPTDKTITFDTDETPIPGDHYECVYSFKPSSSTRIDVNSDAIPAVALVTAFGTARDICNGMVYPVQVEGQAQIDGNWSFDVSADGDPAVQNLNMEFVKGCLNKKLYSFTVFTEEE